jgi:hypothetical protein
VQGLFVYLEVTTLSRTESCVRVYPLRFSRQSTLKGLPQSYFYGKPSSAMVNEMTLNSGDKLT